MRRLLPDPTDELDAGAIHEHYGADWLDTGGIRVNFVSSVDGAAHADGKSAGLQTPGDNAVFGVLRDLADVVLVGAGTAVAEGYGPVSFSDRRLAVRRDLGLAPSAPVALISRSLRLDPSHTMFTDASPDARTIVLTCTDAPDDVRAELAQVADVIDCGERIVEPLRVRSALIERGLRRLLFEGGPTAFAGFAREPGGIDELCLSVSPVLAGPSAGRITAGPDWPTSRPLTLAGLLEEDGALFARYRFLG